ncbi:MAG: cytochrome c-type biogenesis protein CcmH [Chloroflexota bacterium]
MKLKLLGLILCLFWLGYYPVAASGDTVTSVARQLVCLCGCNHVLNNCSEPVCSLRDDMKASIKQQLDQGRTGPQIIQMMTATYGEQVLAAPPKRGFNLTAWLLPFIALAIGAVAIYLGLKAWVKPVPSSETKSPGLTAEDEAYQRRVSREVKEFDGGAFR